MKIRVVSVSDITNNIKDGDYWVKRELEHEFMKRGYDIVSQGADLDFYLFGLYSYAYRMFAPRRMCWVYSHPELTSNQQWITFEKQFEHIFVASPLMLQRYAFKDRKDVSVLYGASSKMYEQRSDNPIYDIVFVGSMRAGKRLDVIRHLINQNKYSIGLVGVGWGNALGDLINKINYRGDYIDNIMLGRFFNQGFVSIYSTQEDMRQAGMVAVRILDTFRSSDNLCIPDKNDGLQYIFREIPTYENEENLVDIIDFYLDNDKERELVQARCREDSEVYTFEMCVDEIEKWL